MILNYILKASVKYLKMLNFNQWTNDFVSNIIFYNVV